MKYIKSILIVLSVFVVVSCSLTDLDLLDNPNAATPESAETGLFFNAIQLDFKTLFMQANNLASTVVRQRAMTGGNVYDNAFTASSFDGMWTTAYAGLFPDMNQLISLTEKDVPYMAGATKILKGYTLMLMVDFFGDIPYSEAGQGVSVLSPKQDDQVALYNEALNLINSGIDDLGKTSPPLENDLFYGGDVSKWMKFANTLKIKWYLNVGSGAGANGDDIKNAAANAITDPADDFIFRFGSRRDSPDSRHWWYINGYENGATTYQSNYFMWELKDEKGIVDPRIRYYFYRQDLTPIEDIDAFTLDCGGTNPPLHYGVNMPYCHLGDGYWGRDHGNNDGIPPDTDRRTVAGVYPAGGKFDADEGASVQNSGKDGAKGAGIAPIMLSSFTHFMMAEAALTRGTGEDPAAHLETAVRQSIAKVMDFGKDQAGALAPSEGDVDAYVAVVMDRFNNAADANAKLDVVMKEYHIALWGNGYEAYNNYRRTTYPSNFQPTLEENPGNFPRLMYYPSVHLNRNENITAQRSLTEQVFWDTNPAGALK